MFGVATVAGSRHFVLANATCYPGWLDGNNEFYNDNNGNLSYSMCISTSCVYCITNTFIMSTFGNNNCYGYNGSRNKCRTMN